MAKSNLKAPEFRLQNQDEKWITLSGLLAQGPVMIVFYPGDFTHVCTQQLCAYQQSYGRFVDYGIRIVGISPNSPVEHRKFTQSYNFSFDLLSDPGKEVTKAYGVISLFLLGGTSRAVVVVGKDASFQYRYVEPTRITHRKPDELLEIIDGLRKSGKI